VKIIFLYLSSVTVAIFLGVNGCQHSTMKESAMPYRIDRLLSIAVQIQALSPEARQRKLEQIAGKGAIDQDCYHLCRLLFVPKGTALFRAPRLGIPQYINESHAKAWPDDPFAIVDGIPFQIVTGYTLAGRPESPIAYLTYCIDSCKWNPYIYQIPDLAQKQAALQKLIDAPPISGHLSPEEGHFLQAQIR
jgi:hypothetical protein